MKKLFFIAASFALVLLASCSKEQQAVNKVEGTWKAVKMTATLSGQSQEVPLSTDLKLTFDKCKLKKDEWCKGRSTSGTDVSEFEYKFTNDGDDLVRRTVGGGDEQTMNVTDLTKSEMTLKYTDDSVIYQIDLEKE